MDGAHPDTSGNVAELVRAFAVSQPDVRALVDMRTQRTVTFGALAQDLDRAAAALRAAGVQPGDRVALFVATGVEFVTLVFACFQAGAVPVLIDPGMGAKNVLACVKEQAPRVLLGIAKAHVLALVGRAAFASVDIKLLVRPGPDGARRGWFPGARALDAVLPPTGAAGDARVAAVGAGDVAAILYTSGSTGAPKGVIYTHGMLAGQAEAIRAMFDIRPGEVDVACFLPFGLFSVAMGMTAVFPDMDFRFPARAAPERVLAAMEGATSAFASPALWEPFSRFLAAARAQGRGVELRGVKRVLTAGAPVRPELHERLLAHLPDGDVFTPYGATEALPVSFMSGRAVVQETAALTRAGKGTCVGALAPGVEVKVIAITDDAIATLRDAREVAQGDVGEIVVRGPCVTQAYDNRAEANRLSKILHTADDEGAVRWHRMGDLGYLDADGRLWFCGRKSQRVETPRGMLTSIPVEAVAETLWAASAHAAPGHARAALVGTGPLAARAQRAIVVLEDAAGALKGAARAAEEARVLQELAARGVVVDACAVYPGAFPVDRRHNAKIERERLARWVVAERPELARGGARIEQAGARAGASS